MATILRTDLLVEYICANGEGVYLSSDAQQKHALVAVSGEGVYIVNVQDSKTIKSWAVSPRTTFASTPLWLASTKYMYVAIGSHQDMNRSDGCKVVWRWNSKDEKLPLDQIMTDQSIHTLLGCVNLKNHILCCHDNSAVSIVAADFSSPPRLFSTEPIVPEEDKTQLISAASYLHYLFDDTQENAAFIIQLLKVGKRCFVQVLSVSTSTKETPSIHLISRHELLSSSLTHSDTTFIQRAHYDPKQSYVSVLFSDGHWQTHKVTIVSHNGTINAQVQLSISYGESIMFLPSASAMLPGYLVLAKFNQADSKTITLSVLDITFGSIQHTCNIPQDLLPPCREGTHLVLTFHPLPETSQLLLVVAQVQESHKKQKRTCKTLILRLSIHMPSITLSSVLGKSVRIIDTITSADPNKAFIASKKSTLALTSHMKLPTAVDPQDWLTSIQEMQTAEVEIIDELRSAPNREAFEKIFMKGVYRITLLHNKRQPRIPFPTVEPVSIKMLPTGKIRKASTRLELSREFTSSVFACMCEVQDSGTGEPLHSNAIMQYLVTTQCVSYTMLGSNLLRAMEERSPKNVCDIPEDQLIAILRRCLTSQTRGKKGYHVVICMVLQYPHTDIFIQQALRLVSSEELEALMHVITMSVDAIMGDPDIRNKIGWNLLVSYKCAPRMDMLAKWVGHILDTHFATIVLNPELSSISSQFADSLVSELKVMTTLEQTVGALHWFLSMERNNEKETRVIRNQNGTYRLAKSREDFDKYIVETLKY